MRSCCGRLCIVQTIVSETQPRDEDKLSSRPVSITLGKKRRRLSMKASAFAFVLAIVVVMVGCVSIEDQLNSPDPATRLVGEHRLLEQARLSGKPEDMLNAVKRVESRTLLLEIAKSARQNRIPEGQLALSKLTDENDFATLACSAESTQIQCLALMRVSQQETLLTICVQARDSRMRKAAMDKLSPESLVRLPYSPALFPYWRRITDQRTLAKIYRDGYGMFSEDDLKAIAEKIDDDTVLGEMVTPLPGPQVAFARRNRENEIHKLSNMIKEMREKSQEHNRKADRAREGWDFSREKRERQKAADLFAKIAPVQKQLNMINDLPVTGLYVTNDTARIALYDRVNDTKVFWRIVSATDEYGRPLFKTREQLKPIFKKMPEDKALEFVLEKLKHFGIYHWSEGDLVPLEIAASLAEVAKDSKTRVSLASVALGALESIKKELKDNSLRYLMSWGDRQESFANEYANGLSLSDEEKVQILCMEGLAGRRIAEIADEKTARKVLTSDRTFDRKIEEKLVAKIPGAKIDLALYESVRSDVVKAALYNKMPQSVKESISMASAAQESIKSNKASMRVSVNDVTIANINMDDVVVAIRTWQKERWNSDKIAKIRKSKGRVEVDDLKLSAHHKDLQPFLDIMVADYVLCVNILDSFVDARTPKDAVAMLLKSISMDDILELAKNLAGAKDSAKSIKDNAGLKDVVPIGKDMITIGVISASMTNASGILKGIFNQLMSK